MIRMGVDAHYIPKTLDFVIEASDPEMLNRGIVAFEEAKVCLTQIDWDLESKMFHQKIPSNVNPAFIIGSQGKTIKTLMSKTDTILSFDKQANTLIILPLKPDSLSKIQEELSKIYSVPKIRRKSHLFTEIG